MATDINKEERAIRNEEKICGIKENLNELKVDFEKYKEKVEQDKRHQENALLLKLGIVVTLISTLLVWLLNYFLK